MGYSTEFKGELIFKDILDAREISFLNKYLGEDRRDFDELKLYNGFDMINLEFNKAFTGIKWDGSEKTYGMCEIINCLLDRLKIHFGKEYIIKGEMKAQGEKYEDRWKVVIKDGRAIPVDIKKEGDKITCPHCEEDFILEN